MRGRHPDRDTAREAPRLPSRGPERPGDDDTALRRHLDALQRWLTRQGVSADVCVETTEGDIAGAMLSRAADLESDLVVMGAYGHARWVERVLAGATHGLLAAMTAPVLLSH